MSAAAVAAPEEAAAAGDDAPAEPAEPVTQTSG
jgi:hypothetical protein